MATRIIMSNGLAVDTKLIYDELKILIEEASKSVNKASYSEKDVYDGKERYGTSEANVNLEKFISVPQIDDKLELTLNIHYIQAFFTIPEDEQDLDEE